jgi:pyruvate dehydrogenase E2 component (dihydrolipoamide acetyltransferase)
MTIFYLPDLGEGLPEAEIVEWHVKVGDTIETDQSMVSVETAKAIVEIPAPQCGRVSELFAQAGEVLETGAPLMSFESAEEADAQIHANDEAQTNTLTTQQEAAPQKEVALQKTGTEASAPAKTHESTATKTSSVLAAPQGKSAPQTPPKAHDKGTVVGNIPENAENLESFFQHVAKSAQHKATPLAIPAARQLATQHEIDLNTVTGSGPNGVIIISDIEAVLGRHASTTPALPQTDTSAGAPENAKASQTETLKGPRRAMAHAMTKAHAEVVKVTIEDDACIHRWRDTEDPTLRLIRAISYACSKEPGLNAWYDHNAMTRTLFDYVNLGMAVDTPDGLYVPVLESVDAKRPKILRGELNTLREQIKTRSIPKERLSGATITLSNFGTIAGRYASPVVSPPQVAIIGAGRSRDAVLAVKGKAKVRRIMPISLSFDHRALTGGEAARFLKALIEDLESKH